MKKKIFLTMVALLTAFGSVYADTYKSINLRMTDPTLLMRVQMEDEMKVSVTNNTLILESDLGTIEFPLSEVTGWTFSTESGSSDEWAGIDAVTPDTEAVTVKVSADAITIHNAAPGSIVTLTAMNGMQVYNATAGSEETEISLGSIQPGVYVLNVANQSLKIAVGL